MEQAGIFPHSHIEKVQHNDRLLYSLARFCECTKATLLRTLEERNKAEGRGEVLGNNTSYKTTLSYGYQLIEKKTGNKIRTILNPTFPLKSIQNKISEHLSRVPVSLAATGGKSGDSHIKNAECHKKNPYLITMDIKNAYPSVNTQRIYANIQGSLYKNLKTRAPALSTDEEKELFLKAITHLCVYNNQLPQGASTSSQLINIVLASIDREIEQKVYEILGEDGIYTRYIDDMSISFPHYPNMQAFFEKKQYYEHKMKEIELIEYPRLFSHKITDGVTTLVDEIGQEVFHIADSYQFSILQRFIQSIQERIEKYTYLDSRIIYDCIGKLHTYRNQIINEDIHIRDIHDIFLTLLNKKGWKVNTKKNRLYTPQSSRLREINGITYTLDGKRGISVLKKNAMIKLFKDLGEMNDDTLTQHPFYKHHFCIPRLHENDTIHFDIEKIIRVVQGKYNYIRSIYNKVPQDIQKAYDTVKKRRDIQDKHEGVIPYHLTDTDDLAF